MTQFEFHELELEGAYLISSFFVDDNRGSFTKSFERDIFKEAGIDFRLHETFASCSPKNVIRGLHFQTHNPQAKLVSVLSGSVWDVIVDIRPDSPTFSHWIAQKLSAVNHLSFFIPRGFAHGFASLEDNTVMLYQCDGKYDPETDTGIRYDDPEIGIMWPVDESVAIHSARDLGFCSIQEYLKHPMGV